MSRRIPEEIVRKIPGLASVGNGQSSSLGRLWRAQTRLPSISGGMQVMRRVTRRVRPYITCGLPTTVDGIRPAGKTRDVPWVRILRRDAVNIVDSRVAFRMDTRF